MKKLKKSNDNVSVLTIYFVSGNAINFNIIFNRMIAAMSPEDSWVCKWQRIGKS